MASIESLKKRISTSEDLHSLVKTMKALAAVSIRQYEKAVESLELYTRTVELGLQAVVRKSRSLSGNGARGSTGLILFGSDQGMCGQFNELIGERVLEEIRAGKRNEEREIRLVALGSRAVSALEERGIAPESEMTMPGSLSGITPLVQDLLLHIESWQEEGVREVILFYNRTEENGSYRQQRLPILPLEREWLASVQKNPWPTNQIPLVTMDHDRLFSHLIRTYLFITLYRACAESLAAENTGRLASMQLAEKNISERLEELQQEYRRERQSLITAELLEIVSGFEALEGGQNGSNREPERG